MGFSIVLFTLDRNF